MPGTPREEELKGIVEDWRSQAYKLPRRWLLLRLHRALRAIAALQDGAAGDSVREALQVMKGER